MHSILCKITLLRAYGVPTVRLLGYVSYILRVDTHKYVKVAIFPPCFCSPQGSSSTSPLSLLASTLYYFKLFQTMNENNSKPWILLCLSAGYWSSPEDVLGIVILLITFPFVAVDLVRRGGWHGCGRSCFFFLSSFWKTFHLFRCISIYSSRSDQARPDQLSSRFFFPGS